MTSDEFLSRLVDVSGKVLNKSRKVILMYLRFMDMAMSKLDFVPVTDGKVATIAVDGEHIYFNPEYVLEQYKESPERVIRDILHMVMHCIFRHNLNYGKIVNTKYWDIACDIAVENAINELAWDKSNDGSFDRQMNDIVTLKNCLSMITAEHIYNHFLALGIGDRELAEYANKFSRDSHESWYSPATLDELKAVAEGRNPNKKNNESDPADSEKKENNQTENSQSENNQTENNLDKNNRDNNNDSSSDNHSDNNSEGMMSRIQSLAEDWKYIGERMDTDLQTFNKNAGDKAGALTQNLREVNREHYDYSAFLRQFAVSCEVMKLNTDEFDYIYYSYGMDEYEDMPFIEPLEYKNEKRIHDFVIAIDTSGSTSGDVVQRFVNKTYNILKQEETFSRKFNLHIVQCDTKIQEDVVITNDEELEEYMKTMKIHGLGGTDFRPVFQYVDELIDNGEFTELKGLIYFTDGCGTYPSKAPDYKTAFVFVEDSYNDYNVPPWSIKLVLRPDEF